MSIVYATLLVNVPPAYLCGVVLGFEVSHGPLPIHTLLTLQLQHKTRHNTPRREQAVVLGRRI